MLDKLYNSTYLIRECAGDIIGTIAGVGVAATIAYCGLSAYSSLNKAELMIQQRPQHTKDISNILDHHR